MEMKKRVVITGLGVVSAVGHSLPEFWDSLISGREGAKEITVFDPAAYRTKIAAEVSHLDPEAYFSKKEVRRLSRCDQFGLIHVIKNGQGSSWERAPAAFSPLKNISEISIKGGRSPRLHSLSLIPLRRRQTTLPLNQG